jgi:hypothetical protein
VVKTQAGRGPPGDDHPDGKIVPFMDVKIMYSKDTGDQDEDGKPDEGLPGIPDVAGRAAIPDRDPRYRPGRGDSFGQGIVFKEVPYQGNPTDLKTLKRCVPSTFEILNRRCLMNTFLEFVDKKEREGKRQLKIVAKLLESRGLTVKSHLGDEDEPYIFVHEPREGR